MWRQPQSMSIEPRDAKSCIGRVALANRNQEPNPHAYSRDEAHANQNPVAHTYTWRCSVSHANPDTDAENHLKSPFFRSRNRLSGPGIIIAHRKWPLIRRIGENSGNSIISSPAAPISGSLFGYTCVNALHERRRIVMNRPHRIRVKLRIAGLGMGLGLAIAFAALAVTPPKSINSTSQNRATPPSTLVSEQLFKTLGGYRIVASNDLGMHCANLDQRAVSILPPFNTLHAQVLRTGKVPVILGTTQAKVAYSAASHSTDPALANAIPLMVFKTNFWDKNPRTLNTYGYDAYNPQYPPGILKLFPLNPTWVCRCPTCNGFTSETANCLRASRRCPMRPCRPPRNPMPQACRNLFRPITKAFRSSSNSPSATRFPG
jgi:hypothetical protein